MNDKSEKPVNGQIAKVKDKAPAKIQIGTEQHLEEMKQRDLKISPLKNLDSHELADYQQHKRHIFEDNIKENSIAISNWLQYANWEESQNELEKARSIFERALEVDNKNVILWFKYTEMVMRHREVNCVRNLWDRAVTILPKFCQFWYKYTYMEEMLENITGARQIFERWMKYKPEEHAWQSYINFELRYKEILRARNIYERFINAHPNVKQWINYANFEENHGFTNGARKVYERAFIFFGDDCLNDKLVIAFAKFAERLGEYERARAIYQYALETLSKDKTEEIYKAYTIHEKKYGDRLGVQNFDSKQKHQLEQELKENPFDYNAWFNYLRLIESEGNVEVVRKTYERAIANVPITREKLFWKRYIYLWINCAIFEELEAENVERCRQIYRACLNLIPHGKFTFSKIWLMYAQFEVRQKNLAVARKFLGMALGICPRKKLYRGYIDIEMQLKEFDRCRILYQNFLEFAPETCTTWMKFAEMETFLKDIDRARAIYELAVAQPVLDTPDVLWKAYIDFEIGQDTPDKARQSYEKLLEKTLHANVWISYAKFELTNTVAEEGINNVVLARRIFERGNNALWNSRNKESRVLLLEAWRDFELEHGDEESQAEIMKKMPRRVKRRCLIIRDDVPNRGWEEIYEYIFPEEIPEWSKLMDPSAKTCKEEPTVAEEGESLKSQ